MADLAPYQRLEFAFATLLNDLAKTWSSCDIDYVRDIVAHAEFGEALENLAALGRRNGAGFSTGQLCQIKAMASEMKLDISPLLATQPVQGENPPRTSAA
jgi:hypothetical protein